MNPFLVGLCVALVCCLFGASGHSLWAVESLIGAPSAARAESTTVPEEGDLESIADSDEADAEAAGGESSASISVRVPDPIIHPLARLDERVIGDLVAYDIAALGPMSVGAPNRGALINPVQFPEGPYWHRNDADRAWGTAETVQFVKQAIERVNEEHPDSPVLYVGDFSNFEGGTLKRHKSHQSGRDVDLGYYYLDKQRWYRPANAKNLDRARTWTLVRTLLTESPVEYIFMDTSVQRLLRAEALAQGEDPAWLARVFEGGPGRKESIIRHKPGHATHLHVRFDNPVAQLSAERAYPWLVRGRLLPSRVAKAIKPRRAKR